MFPLLTGILLVGAHLLFAYSIYSRGLLFASSHGYDNRLTHIKDRVIGTIKYAFGQLRFLNKKRDFRAGLMHAIIFWGFLVISLRTITLFGIGFNKDFNLPFLVGPLGVAYAVSLNTIAVLVTLACSYGMYRRVVVKPKRITKSSEGVIILGIILSLMLTDFLFDATTLLLDGKHTPGAFVGPIVAAFLPASNIGFLSFVQGASFLLHLALLLSFLNFLPYGKHFHIITGIPNVFFRNLKPYGQLTAINFENENVTQYGNDKIEHFSWKNYLDWFTCTECGRCQDMCPAFNSEKPLSPKELTITLRDFLYRKQSLLNATHQGVDIPRDENGYALDETTLLGDNIAHETLWSCTTCRACEEACPVFIEYVQEIVDMRRNLVMMQGSFPAEVQTVFQNMERNYNPWGIGFSDRGSWAKEIGVPTLAENSDVEYLYFAGCAANFDDKNKKVAIALSKMLQKAGVSFGILGAEEKCTGDSARRIGNEYLAQMLMKENIATFENYKVKKVITSCPHCFNTIKNEFPQFGGNYEVVHHTQILNDLIKQEKLVPQKKATQSITYHDSCYLGRYNGVYDAPREILKSIPGVEVREPELTRESGRCCGAGGGRMWIEEKVGKRVNEMRLNDLKQTKAETAATACPFCKIMVTDAINQTKSDGIQSKDIVEILADAIQ